MCVAAISSRICLSEIQGDVCYMGLNLKDGKHSHPMVGSSSRYRVLHSISLPLGTGFIRAGATHFERDKRHSPESCVPMWPVSDVESLRVFTSHRFVVQSSKLQKRAPNF